MDPISITVFIATVVVGGVGTWYYERRKKAAAAKALPAKTTITTPAPKTSSPSPLATGIPNVPGLPAATQADVLAVQKAEADPANQFAPLSVPPVVPLPANASEAQLEAYALEAAQAAAQALSQPMPQVPVNNEYSLSGVSGRLNRLRK